MILRFGHDGDLAGLHYLHFHRLFLFSGWILHIITADEHAGVLVLIPSGFRTSRGLIIVLVECGFQSSGVPERDLLKSVFRTAS